MNKTLNINECFPTGMEEKNTEGSCFIQVKPCLLTVTIFSQFDLKMMTLNPGFNGSRFNGLDRVAVLIVPMERHSCLSTFLKLQLTIRMATKQAMVVFQSPPVAAALPTRTL